MGVFDDKKFENLDWMTQMTETIESELNATLAKLPEETIIDYAFLKRTFGSSRYLSLSASSIVRYLLGMHCPNSKLSYDEKSKIEGCFEFEVSEEIVLNDLTKELTGTIKLIKTQTTFEDEVLQQFLGSRGIERLRAVCFDIGGGTLGRANEIMELLGGCDKAMSCRSVKKKKYAISDRVTKIMRSNEWRIRDTELANKMSYWIVEYIAKGNLAALTNFCKLKVMTHSNMPIYSIQEESL